MRTNCGLTFKLQISNQYKDKMAKIICEIILNLGHMYACLICSHIIGLRLLELHFRRGRGSHFYFTRMILLARL